MSDQCLNCGAAITIGSAFKGPNFRRDTETVAFVNFVTSSDYRDLCGKCDNVVSEAHTRVKQAIADRLRFIESHATSFPMFTTSWLPAGTQVRFKNMITANVTVGTGLINEFSQGLTDFFGAVNTQSGMTHKINKGETIARSILIAKAVALGANCIVGVDIDYGTTVNNASTINMQGTAALISNLNDVLDEEDFRKAQEVIEAYARVEQLKQWQDGNIAA